MASDAASARPLARRGHPRATQLGAPLRCTPVLSPLITAARGHDALPRPGPVRAGARQCAPRLSIPRRKQVQRPRRSRARPSLTRFASAPVLLPGKQAGGRPGAHVDGRPVQGSRARSSAFKHVPCHPATGSQLLRTQQKRAPWLLGNSQLLGPSAGASSPLVGAHSRGPRLSPAPADGGASQPSPVGPPDVR